jgi:hypothetical protein
LLDGKSPWERSGLPALNDIHDDTLSFVEGRKGLEAARVRLV